MEFILAMGGMVTLVTAGHMCRSTVDYGIRWNIDCSSMNLSIFPPPVIFHPVVTLDISRNSFQHLVESQFMNWSDILHLDISYNFIDSIDADSFKGLNNLTELNLMHNKLKSVSTNLTSHLTRLKILNLSFNELKTILPDAFVPIPSLLILSLGSNPELGKDWNNYQSLNLSFSQCLISLDFSNASLQEIPYNFFRNAIHIIGLNIAHNPLNEIPDLPSGIRYLNLSGTLLKTLPHVLEKYSLKKLSLEEMPILKEIGDHSLSGLTSLEELYMNNCSLLSFISEDAFGESIPKLRKVVLSNCSLVTLPKTFKTLLEKVDYLDLQGNPWICDGRISWILTTNILPNLTENLRCDKPLNIRGTAMTEYFKPRSLHPHHSVIRAGIVIAFIAVLVCSVVAMVRHESKQRIRTYRHLQDIRLQDLSPDPT